MGFPASAIAVNVKNQGANLVGDHAASVTVLTLTNVDDFPAAGEVSIDGTVYAYSTAPDDELLTLTLDAATTLAYSDDTRVQVYPAQPVYYATVNVGSDQPGVNALIPHNLVPLMSEQMLTSGIPVMVDQTDTAGFSWIVTEVPGRAAVHDANQAPIIVSTDDGESVRIDGDGISTFTDDPVPVRTISTLATHCAAADGYVFTRLTTSGGIQKHELSTGLAVAFLASVGNTASGRLAAGGGFVFLRDGLSSDIRKFDATTGVEDVTGWPVVGTFGDIYADDSYVYAISSGDVHRFDIDTGTEETTVFPLAGDWIEPASSGEYLFVYDNTNDFQIHKFDAATGSEVIDDGWPTEAMVGRSMMAIQPNGSVLLTKETDDETVEAFDATTGELLWTTTEDYGSIAADSGLLIAVASVVNDSPNSIRIFNASAGYNSTRTDSSTGAADFHAVTVSDLTSTGAATFDGTLEGGADHMRHVTTIGRVTSTQTVATGVAHDVHLPTFDGTSSNGDTPYWTYGDISNRYYSVLQDGLYAIAANVAWPDNNTGVRSMRIMINGSSHAGQFGTEATGGAMIQNASIPAIELAAGDTVRLSVTQDSGSGLNIASATATWLSLTRLGVVA